MRGVGYFKQALQRSRDYAPAYAGLADAYLNVQFNTPNPNETLRKAEEAVKTALSLDDRLPEAHFAKARILSRNWAWRGAIQEIERTIQLEPSYGPALNRRGDLLLYAGREQEARFAFQKAEAVDPMMPNLLERKLLMLFYMRRFDEVVELSKQYPDVLGSSYYLGRAYAEKGALQEGIALLETNWSSSRRGQGFGALAALYARAGRRADATKLLDEVRERAKRTYIKPSSMAQLYIGLGDFDEAFRWLDRAYEEHDPTLSSLKLEICWDPIRNDQRFKSLLKKVHLDE
jgi:tetratricopeptide (TPR) repeat protein